MKTDNEQPLSPEFRAMLRELEAVPVRFTLSFEGITALQYRHIRQFCREFCGMLQAADPVWIDEYTFSAELTKKAADMLLEFLEAYAHYVGAEAGATYYVEE